MSKFIKGGKVAVSPKPQTRKERILERWPDAARLKTSKDYK